MHHIYLLCSKRNKSFRWNSYKTAESGQTEISVWPLSGVLQNSISMLYYINKNMNEIILLYFDNPFPEVLSF